jgi:hypothetical protein
MNERLSWRYKDSWKRNKMRSSIVGSGKLSWGSKDSERGQGMCNEKACLTRGQLSQSKPAMSKLESVRRNDKTGDKILQHLGGLNSQLS